MKNLLYFTFLIFTLTTYAQSNNKFVVHYSTTSSWNSENINAENKPSSQALYFAEQLKKDIESMEYELRVDGTKSEFSMINKLNAPGKRENYVAAVEKNERFYIDAGEYINQKEFQGDEFLITAPSNQIQWTLKNEKKQILGFECLKAEYISTEHGKSLKVVAWYAPKLPFQFGPKGYHGLPGLILQLVQNNKIIYTADSIMEDANVWVLKPTTGKKITLEKFNTLVDATATEMEASRKN